MADRTQEELWGSLAKSMKNKRVHGKGTAKKSSGLGENILSEKEMIVQRLASEASGKAMKYERIGPQEFVTYPFDEITLDNIKTACYHHFKDRLTHSDMVCDVLASQNGPSCNKLSHLSNFKKIHVRFVKVKEDDIPYSAKRPRISDRMSFSVYDKIRQSKKSMSYTARRYTADIGSSSSGASGRTPHSSILPSIGRQAPKSLSVSSMLNLGKVISKTINTTESFQVYEFCIDSLAWKSVKVEKFYVEKESFARGGFREVFKAKNDSNRQYVIKRFLPESIQMMEQINTVVEKKETVETLCRKAVQMHSLARNLTYQFKECTVGKSFGPTFVYRDAKLGISENGESVVIEDFIPGFFSKYVNNDGIAAEIEGEDLDFVERVQKAEALAHFSFIKSHMELILLDIQGAEYVLYDPEIATSSGMQEKGELRFCIGNLSEVACRNFIKNHECNKYCKVVNLQNIAEK